MAKIELQISEQTEEDMLVGALEGGSNFWYWIGDKSSEIIDRYNKGGEPFAISMWKAIKDGQTIEIHDLEDKKTKLGEINLKSIEEGEQLMAEKSPMYFMQMYLETDDAETADVWFQYCVLKEIVYG